MKSRPADGRAGWLRRRLVLAGVVVVLTTPPSAARAEDPMPAPGGLIDVLREQILTHLKLEPGMRVAEIGVGGGWFVVKVSEAIGPKGVIYGTDIDPKAIERMRQRVPKLPPSSARVELRLCENERDTALDDLPEGSLDLILMIDSLCFDASTPREVNVGYLRRFLRLLRPGGRLVHHMDCRCEVSTKDLVALFRDGGFPYADIVDVAADPARIEADWPCRTEVERARHAVLGIFRKYDPGKGRPEK